MNYMLLALVIASTFEEIRYRLRTVTALSVRVGYGPLVPATGGLVSNPMRTVKSRVKNEAIMVMWIILVEFFPRTDSIGIFGN